MTRLVLFRRSLLVLLVCSTLGGIWLASRPARLEPLHPSSTTRRQWNVYDDRVRGGESRCEVLSGGDTLRVAVRTGASYGAYWGIEWGPGSQGDASLGQWSWSSRDSLVFVWKARRARSQRIYLCSRDPALTNPADPLTRRYLSADLPIDSGWTRTSIPLSELEPPVWWLELHPGIAEPRKAFLESILVMQIGPGSGAYGQDDTIEIASIDRRPGSRMPIFPIASGICLAGVVGWALLERRLRSGKANHVPLEVRRVQPRPVDAPLPDQERLDRFLAENYHRVDLDLAKVASELRLSARRVTTLINGSGEGFKAALNRMRLQEARRLLQDTDLQISEIAFKVGYGNVSHFNRTFRERFGMAPGALRTALRNEHDPARNATPDENAKDQADNA